MALICNEEGKLPGMELNRGLLDDKGALYDVMAGTFLVVGLGDENCASLSPELIQKYTEQFKTPELFMQVNGKIVSVPVSALEQDQAHISDRFETGACIQTLKGSFAVTDRSRE